MPTPLTPVDLKRLAAEVSVQHGIRIDPDDPMLAVVTLNRLVFEHAVAQVLERMQSSVRDFEAATEKVQIRAGVVLAQEVRNCGTDLRRELSDALAGSDRSDSVFRASRPTVNLQNWRAAVCLCALGLVLFAAGVLIGRVLR
jgi:hypothetical protein